MYSQQILIGKYEAMTENGVTCQKVCLFAMRFQIMKNVFWMAFSQVGLVFS